MTDTHILSMYVVDRCRQRKLLSVFARLPEEVSPCCPFFVLQDTQGTERRVPGVSSNASDSLRELLNLSKKLEAVRGPPRVVEVQGAAQLSASKCAVEQNVLTAASAIGGATKTNKEIINGCLSSASSSWNAQQVLNARLATEWREGQGRAEKAIGSLVGASGVRGEIWCYIRLAGCFTTFTSKIHTCGVSLSSRFDRFKHVHPQHACFALLTHYFRGSIARLQLACGRSFMPAYVQQLCTNVCWAVPTTIPNNVCLCVVGSGSFGEGMAAELPTTQSVGGEGSGHLRVARLHLPYSTCFVPFKARQAAVPVTLGRTSLGRLQEALAV